MAFSNDDYIYDDDIIDESADDEIDDEVDISSYPCLLYTSPSPRD